MESVWIDQYVEVYGSDLAFAVDQTVPAKEGTRLKANLPE